LANFHYQEDYHTAIERYRHKLEKEVDKKKDKAGSWRLKGFVKDLANRFGYGVKAFSPGWFMQVRDMSSLIFFFCSTHNKSYTLATERKITRIDKRPESVWEGISFQNFSSRTSMQHYFSPCNSSSLSIQQSYYYKDSGWR
jgi:hypothetical protein